MTSTTTTSTTTQNDVVLRQDLAAVRTNLLFRVQTDLQPDAYLQAMGDVIKAAITDMVPITPNLETSSVQLVIKGENDFGLTPQGWSRRLHGEEEPYSSDEQANLRKMMERAQPRRLVLQSFYIAVTVLARNAVEQYQIKGFLNQIAINSGSTVKTQFFEALEARKASLCDATCPPLPTVDNILATPAVFADVFNFYTFSTTTTSSQYYIYVALADEKRNYGWVIASGIIVGLCIMCSILMGVYYRKSIDWDKMALKPTSKVEPLPAAEPAQGDTTVLICDPDGNPLTGHSFQEWRGGGTYQGQVKNGLRDGDGRMVWPNGKSYAGQWLDGRPNGHGLWHAPGVQDWSYNGQFRGGQRHGTGRCESIARGIWYDGDWNNGDQTGMGENGQFTETSGVSVPMAYLSHMHEGEQTEIVSVAKVTQQAQDTIQVTLKAKGEDRDRLQAAPHTVGQLQLVSRLWGFCIGVPDKWLPTKWSALLLTRIMHDSPIGRWNTEAIDRFGGTGFQVHPNALIWSVNGVSGDTEQMVRQLCAEDRNTITLTISLPAHIRYPRETGSPWGTSQVKDPQDAISSRAGAGGIGLDVSQAMPGQLPNDTFAAPAAVIRPNSSGGLPTMQLVYRGTHLVASDTPLPPLPIQALPTPPWLPGPTSPGNGPRAVITKIPPMPSTAGLRTIPGEPVELPTLPKLTQENHVIEVRDSKQGVIAAATIQRIQPSPTSPTSTASPPSRGFLGETPNTSQLPLPPGWTESFDASTNQSYYHNRTTGQTTWDRPTIPSVIVSGPQDVFNGRWFRDGTFKAEVIGNRVLMDGRELLVTFPTPTEIHFTEWSLSGRLDNAGTAIHWSNGSVWRKQEALQEDQAKHVVDFRQDMFDGRWFKDGAFKAEVIGNRVLVDRCELLVTFPTPTEIQFSEGSLRGRLDNAGTAIHWSNGSVWHKQAKAEAQAEREARIRADAEAAAEAKLRAEAEARMRAEAEAKAQAEDQADREARIRADAESAAEAKLRAEAAAAKRKAEIEAEAEARMRAEAEAKASLYRSQVTKGAPQTNPSETPSRPGSEIFPIEDLPAGWESAWSEDHKKMYYFNRTTGGTSWDKPQVLQEDVVVDFRQEEVARPDLRNLVVQDVEESTARPTVGDMVRVLHTQHTRVKCPELIGQSLQIILDLKDGQPYRVQGSNCWLFPSDVELQEKAANLPQQTETILQVDSEGGFRTYSEGSEPAPVTTTLPPLRMYPGQR
jgi:hypothetical protein